MTKLSNYLETRDKVRDAIHQPICSLRISAWKSREPLAFNERHSGVFASHKVGDRWGEYLFDCAWFCFEAELPPRTNQLPLEARIDVNGELLVVDTDGRPVRGLTNIRSEFARELGEPGKIFYPLAPEIIAKESVEIWADAAFNDLFGGVQGNGRIVCADVCEVREDLRALFYDFEVLCEVLSELSADLDLCQRVEQLMDAACARIDTNFDTDAVAAARGILAPLFETSAKTDSLRVWAVGHAHLDLAWLWPIRETIRKGLRTFSTAMANRKLYPEHVLGMSQPQLYAWIKERDPEFFEEIRKLVAKGAIELQGKFWVEPDCNIPNGESFVRQVLHGSRFYRENFGIIPKQCWQPDVFGYNGQLPQILSKSGHDTFMTQKLSWNVVNRFPHHSFNWEGIDGSQILTHMLPEETYNGPAAPRSLRKIRDEYAQRDVSGHALMCFGIGDGGGGPGQEHLERLRRLRAFETLPSVEVCKSKDFFSEWRKDADHFPHWQGELYLERHQGTLTTQALVKRNNRRCEIALREVECLSVLAQQVADFEYPSEKLDTLWKEVLLYQFHDILPGSSIKRVYDECNPRYAAILDQIESMADAAYTALLTRIDSNGSAVVLNALSQARKDWVEHEGEWYSVETPAMGVAQLPTEASPISATLNAGENDIRNDKIRLSFNDDGSISSIEVKGIERPILQPSAGANQLLVYPDNGDAWDFASDLPNKNVWLYLSERPEVPVLVSASSAIEGPVAIMRQVYSFRNSRIEQDVILRDGSDLVEFATRINWQETASMLRVKFPTTVMAETARFEIPFGSIHRTTRDNDSISKAQIEVPAQQWVELSDKEGGLALYNDCKYGFRIKGGTIEMTLLRSVPYPRAALVAAYDSDVETTSESPPEFTDLGKHEFRYAIQISQSPLAESQLTMQARAFNQPLRIRKTALSVGAKFRAPFSLLTSSNSAVEIVSVKKAEDQNNTVLRLCNVSPNHCTTDIETLLKYSTYCETDLLEQAISDAPDSGDTPIRLEFSPFEVKTVLLNSPQ